MHAAESSPALPPVLPDWPTLANGWSQPSWPKPWCALGTVRRTIGSATPYVKLLVAIAGTVAEWPCLLLTDVVNGYPCITDSIIAAPSVTLWRSTRMPEASLHGKLSRTETLGRGLKDLTSVVGTPSSPVMQALR